MCAMIEKLRICDWSMGGYSVEALALSYRRIANSTTGLRGPTAATRRPSGRRPVQVSGVLSRPGETHSPGTYVVSGDLCRAQAGWASVHPASAQPLRATELPYYATEHLM